MYHVVLYSLCAELSITLLSLLSCASPQSRSLSTINHSYLSIILINYFNNWELWMKVVVRVWRMFAFRKQCSPTCTQSWVCSSNISKTRKSVSSDIQTLRSGLKNEAQAEFLFFNHLWSVLISDETLFRVLDIASQSIDNSEIQSKSSPNFMIIRIMTYQNLLHGSDFLCFLFINYL